MVNEGQEGIKELIRKWRRDGISWETACDEVERQGIRKGKDSQIIDTVLSLVDDVYCEPPFDWEKRRRRRRQVYGKHTKKEWEALKLQYNFRCVYCGKRTQKLTKDHILPISKGGTNDIKNILPSCWKCNFAKHTKLVYDFVPALQKKML